MEQMKEKSPRSWSLKSTGQSNKPGRCATRMAVKTAVLATTL
jgi:hypothetical protein